MSETSLTDAKVVVTEHMQTAAALLAQGEEWTLAGVSPTGRPGICTITVTVPAGREAEAERIVAAGYDGLDIEVNLGRYEAAFRKIRSRIKRLRYDMRGAED